MRWPLWTLILLATNVLVYNHISANAQRFLLRVSSLQYQNPRHLNSDGKCCIDQNSNDECSGECSANIRICLGLSEEVCLRIDDINDDFNLGSRTKMFGNISMSGRYTLSVEVNNIGDESSLLTLNQNIDISSIGTTREFTSNPSDSRIASLSLAFQVLCGLSYFGSTCSVHCVPTNDITGHFTCGDDGEMICLPGFTNTDSGGRCLTCTSPNCQEGADSIGGNTGMNSPSGNNDSSSFSQGGGEEGALSGGGVAGIVIAVIIIAAILGAGVVVGGVLLWKYQPWGNGMSKIGRKKNDTINNPTYAIEEFPTGTKNNRSESRPTRDLEESSPLYSEEQLPTSNNVQLKDQVERNIPAGEDKQKCDNAVTPKKREPPPAPKASHSDAKEAGKDVQKPPPRPPPPYASSKQTTPAKSINLYGSYRDSAFMDTAAGGEQDYEPVEHSSDKAPEVFDDPEYG